MTNRIILIDWSVFMFRAIFSSYKNQQSKIPATYTTMSMILACLKELNASVDDKIIIAIDSKKGSWRKEYDRNYKANRKAKRQEFDIDWDYWFKEYGKLKDNLKENTIFYVAEVDKMEADDIIAYAVRYYRPTQCVIVSTDSDYEQLTCYDNVKVFSPVSKKFKVVKNPYGLLAKKIEIERADNLLSPVLTEADYNLRKMLVDLTTLPDFVEEKVKKELDNLQNNAIINYDRLKFQSLHKRYVQLFNKPKRTNIQAELV